MTTKEMTAKETWHELAINERLNGNSIPKICEILKS